MRHDFPVVLAIKVFGYANGSRLVLAVFDSDLKSLFNPVGSLIDSIVGPIALADNIEGVACIDTKQFIFWGIPKPLSSVFSISWIIQTLGLDWVPKDWSRRIDSLVHPR